MTNFKLFEKSINFKLRRTKMIFGQSCGNIMSQWLTLNIKDQNSSWITLVDINCILAKHLRKWKLKTKTNKNHEVWKVGVWMGLGGNCLHSTPQGGILYIRFMSLPSHIRVNPTSVRSILTWGRGLIYLKHDVFFLTPLVYNTMKKKIVNSNQKTKELSKKEGMNFWGWY